MGYGIVNTGFPVQAEAFDPAGSAAAVQASLNAHTGNKSNPHGVSPGQIGAAAASHTHDASQITAGILSAARGGTGAESIAELAALLGVNDLPYVKLARIVTEQDVEQVDVNISGYDLSKYAELILVPYVRSDASIIYVRVNNLSDNIYQDFRGDHSTVLTFFYDYDYGYVLPVRLTVTNRLTCPSATFPTYVPSSFVPPDGDITLNLYGDSGQPLSAGSEIILYGVRK